MTAPISRLRLILGASDACAPRLQAKTAHPVLSGLHAAPTFPSPITAPGKVFETQAQRLVLPCHQRVPVY